MNDWQAHLQRERGRYEDGIARLADEPSERQRQLTRVGNAAYGAGLALLMEARREEAAEWLGRAAERYRESFADAPPGSWGRPIAALKARLLSSDWAGAEAEARWTIELDAVAAESPIGRYAGTLALLVLGQDEQARAVSASLRDRDDFPHDVADALATIAAEDRLGYVYAIESVLESFETRPEYLEDVPVADTVLVLQALAARRGIAAELQSSLLPPS